MNAPAWLSDEPLKQLISAWNALITSIYKIVGFAMLTLILVGLACYFGVNAFYLFADSWVAPVILSPHHERVLHVSSQALAHQHQRRKLEGELMELESLVATADRGIVLNEDFQRSFNSALSEEITSRKTYLAQAERLDHDQRESERAVMDTNQAFLETAAPELEAQYEAGLLDRATYTQARRSLAAMTQSELSLRQSVLQLSSVVRDSRRAVDSMQGALDPDAVGTAGEARSYDVLVMKQEFQRSVIESAHLRRERDNGVRLIGLLQESIASYDQLLVELDNSPYKRALVERVNLAFVPYENLDEVSEGRALYGCSAGLIWCRPVGRVITTLDGEVAVNHPLRSELVRGLMIEIDLDDASWAEEKALYLGSAPLFF